MKALHQVRAVALTDYWTVASAVGLDPTAMLERFELTPTILSSSEARLPAATVSRLLEASAEASGCDSFALLMARRRTFDSLGPIVKVLKRLSSLRDIISATNGLRRQLNDVFELEIAEGDSGPEFVVVGVLPQFAGPQARYLVTAMTHVLLRGASHGAWKPVTVRFPAPAVSDISAFEMFFGAPVVFEGTACTFECKPGALDHQFRDNPLVAASELVSILEEETMSLRSSDASIVKELKLLLASIRLQIGAYTGGMD